MGREGEANIKWRKYMETYAFVYMKTRKHDVNNAYLSLPKYDSHHNGKVHYRHYIRIITRDNHFAFQVITISSHKTTSLPGSVMPLCRRFSLNAYSLQSYSFRVLDLELALARGSLMSHVIS